MRARSWWLLSPAAAAVAAAAWGWAGDRGPAGLSPPERDETQSGGAGAALEGRAEPPAAAEEGTDPSTGRRTRASLELVTPDGTPAAGVSVTYRDPAVRPEAWIDGTTDAAGRLALRGSVVGRRIALDVPAGPTWAAEHFDVWALESTRVVLSPGCEVWLVLRAGDARLVGAECAFRIDGVEHAVRVNALRSLLGTFCGSSCDVLTVGDVPMKEKRRGVILPPRGRVDVPFDPAGDLGPIAVRFRAPEGAGERPRVVLSSRGHRSAEALDVSGEGPDWVEFVVGNPLRQIYLASCGERVAIGGVDLAAVEAGAVLPPRWDAGCRLELVLPDPGVVTLARAFVVSDPAEPFEPETSTLVPHVALPGATAPGTLDLASSWGRLPAARGRWSPN